MTDISSVPSQILLTILMVILYGFFSMTNTAFNAAGRNNEKIQSANKLLALLTATAGAYFASSDWRIFIGYFVILIIIGQYFCRKLALQHSDRFADLFLVPLDLLSTFLRPLTWFLMLIANLLLKMFHQNVDISDGTFSEEEVMSMLEVGQESGVIKEEGKKMINSIFAFDDKLAYEIMTPRTDVFIIDIDDAKEEYMDDLMTMRYSRIPVCQGDTDNIIGILHVKDYLIQAKEIGFEKVDLKSILRKAYFVPETKNIDSLFFELKKLKQQIAVLIDEYGGFSGIVTMEDIIEQVMGDITDEYDEEEEIIEKLDDSTYMLDGDVTLEDFNEAAGIHLSSESSETIGGFLIDMLGEIPQESDIGKEIRYENLFFKIISAADRRIEKVKVTIQAENEKEAAPETEAAE